MQAHRESLAVLDAKSELHRQRAAKVAELEEMLRVAREGLKLAAGELDKAVQDKKTKAEVEHQAVDRLKQAKTDQATAEEAHRLAHTDMIERVNSEREKLRKRQYNEQRHKAAKKLVTSETERQSIVAKQAEVAVESAMAYARTVVERRDAHAAAKLECWVAVDEKRVRGVEELAAVDWWDAESARRDQHAEQVVAIIMIVLTMGQISAAQRKEELKKAELRADWEDRRSVFARNRARQEHQSEIEAAQRKEEQQRTAHETARQRADKTKTVYESNAAKARESTEGAKHTRGEFEKVVAAKRAEIAKLEPKRAERATKAYREFIGRAAEEVAASGAVDPATLEAKVERALEMAMQGIDTYSAVSVDKKIRPVRQPTARSNPSSPAPAESEVSPRPSPRSARDRSSSAPRDDKLIERLNGIISPERKGEKV